MKSPTLMIERVANGWLVRPWTPKQADFWSLGDQVETFVYTKIEDLQKDLPNLLNIPPEPIGMS